MKTIFLYIFTQHIVAQEKRLSGSASRTMAAISLGFIVMVTPWTIQEVVAACTGSKVMYTVHTMRFYFSRTANNTEKKCRTLELTHKTYRHHTDRNIN